MSGLGQRAKLNSGGEMDVVGCSRSSRTDPAPLRGGEFRRGGIGPGIAAGIIAGSAIGAGAYYGGYGPGCYDHSYAYDNGYGAGYDDGYAVRNGFVCQPGTFFRGEDGRRYLCQ